MGLDACAVHGHQWDEFRQLRQQGRDSVRALKRHLGARRRAEIERARMGRGVGRDGSDTQTETKERREGSMSTIESKLQELESRIAKLEGAPKTQASGGGDTLPLSKLSESWAQKAVRRVPKNWKHRDVTGMQYADLTAEECLDLAGYHTWAANKGKTEQPVRLKTNGKPWWEADEFEAKLLRTHAAAKTANPDASRYGTSGTGANAKHTGSPEPDAFDVDSGSDLPF
jgi:hypothetical protein